MKIEKMKQLSDYTKDKGNWITLAGGEYYPDVLKEACKIYQPFINLFGNILGRSDSSANLIKDINKETTLRVQLMRIFRKYVAPNLPVEMLKRKNKIDLVIKSYVKTFRPINIVQSKFNSRPNPDEALCALLYEYKDRGKKGYDLTERFFDRFTEEHPLLKISGPKRAGQDILLSNVFKNYPNPNRPTDFVISDNDDKVLAVGFARYDGDRGGAQEDDRTGENQNCAREILSYFEEKGLSTKIIFLNDGPGLLLGTMWRDYVNIENEAPNRVMVLTLRMMTERLTESWLKMEL